MRITKVYTRTGDSGETSLVGGQRVGKDSPRVDAYGEIDEVNSLLGLVRCHVQDKEIDGILATLQNTLFTVGADLASPLNLDAPRITREESLRLERTIDEFNRQIPPLKEFVLPGGAPAGALLHLARAVTRRAERKVVKLSKEEAINPELIVYLNRLSDLLFVLARVVNRRAGISEEQASFASPPRTRKKQPED
ncbi:MAG TPA: cob(I)yrinic acid a,c-diamide adenosyltransferase [Blastocatellia bacterium]|nr:cob(I)yrinic acid a,c-diamide adenosyltransferase [Blastocatellia bacterium]